MILSNFELLKTGITGKDDVVKIGSVDVTTGYLWWKKKVNKGLGSRGGTWFFSDNGVGAPIWQMIQLERAWETRDELKKELN